HWDYEDDLVRHLIPAGQTTPAHHYFRGSMLLALVSAAYFLNRVETEHGDAFRDIVADELRQLIHRIHDHVVEEIGKLE
ncbi:MAG: hypothetical protein AB1918_00910, partial [Pseudomonadota bacterium]